MEIKEAIAELKAMALAFGYGSRKSETLEESPYGEAVDMAISALYKQEPMRPRKNTICYPHMPDVTVVQCPTCDRRLRTKRTTAKGDIYCPDCGQKILWE